MKAWLNYKIKDGLHCDIADENLQARVLNNLGPTEEDKTRWTEYKALTPANKKLLEDCSSDSGGCPLPISHNSSTNSKSGAHGTAVLVTGPPNPNGDFLKTVTPLVYW